MRSYLQTKALGKTCICLSSIDSTSTYLRNLWTFLPHGALVMASEQLSGRGRSGKTFHSPKDNGLYFSVLLKDSRYIKDPLFTIKVSYALCRAIDTFTGTQDVKIKWVNDIYYNQKKLAGILCEIVHDGNETGVLVGIGVNFMIDKGTLPSELRGIVTSIREITKKKLQKELLCAIILKELEDLYDAPMTDAEFLAAYRIRSSVLGKEIEVYKDGIPVRAAALDIASDGGLIVRYASGITEKITTISRITQTAEKLRGKFRDVP